MDMRTVLAQKLSGIQRQVTSVTAKFPSSLRAELYTLWLFTRSDMKTIVIPQSIFGVLGGLPQSHLTQPGAGAGGHDGMLDTLRRAPLVVLWVWIILCPFNIDNQRRPEGIAEDAINRPWRPLPAKRVTPRQAWALQLLFHALALLYSLAVGGARQWVLGIILGWLYNGAGLADRSCVGKNAVNAFGYVTFAMGAVSVASGISDFTVQGLQWFAMMGCTIFTTVQMQDLEDVRGDAARGRRTVPLMVGDHLCRWSIAVLVPWWSLVACYFWGLQQQQQQQQQVNPFAVLCNALGFFVAWRVLNRKAVEHDRVTFRFWNVWIVSLYVLPLARHLVGKDWISSI